MIIQPYIENAIWHGLMHKSENRKLEIDIHIEERHFLFTILDNGIGREKARELKSKSSTHKSFGMNITRNRINLINSQNGLKASADIQDLYDETGNPTGTKAVIRLPIIYKEKNNG
jgi:LytS/YehU family sensor histidine kinase